MKTKKQVIDAFVRLQKKYIDIRGFATVKAYKGDDTYWSVEIVVTAFEGNEIAWQERVQWTHYSNQNEAEEARNATNVAEFEKRMEGRI